MSIEFGMPKTLHSSRVVCLSTNVIEQNLRQHFADIKEFAKDMNVGLFVLR